MPRGTAPSGSFAPSSTSTPSTRMRSACSSSAMPTGGACPEAGATLVVTIRTTVALPLVPPVLGLDRLASIPVEASAVQKVSRFWEAE